jgi:hypothetical protein
MSSLSVVQFTAPHTDQRHATTLPLHPRTAQLSAGDWIRPTSDTASASGSAQAWTSLTLGEDEVVSPRIHELALGDPVEETSSKGGILRWMMAKLVTVAVDSGGRGRRKGRRGER